MDPLAGNGSRDLAQHLLTAADETDPSRTAHTTTVRLGTEGEEHREGVRGSVGGRERERECGMEGERERSTERECGREGERECGMEGERERSTERERGSVGVWEGGREGVWEGEREVREGCIKFYTCIITKDFIGIYTLGVNGELKDAIHQLIQQSSTKINPVTYCKNLGVWNTMLRTATISLMNKRIMK